MTSSVSSSLGTPTDLLTSGPTVLVMIDAARCDWPNCCTRLRRTKFPREAVTDGENMKLIAEGAVAQVKKVTKGAVG